MMQTMDEAMLEAMATSSQHVIIPAHPDAVTGKGLPQCLFSWISRCITAEGILCTNAPSHPLETASFRGFLVTKG